MTQRDNKEFFVANLIVTGRIMKRDNPALNMIWEFYKLKKKNFKKRNP